MSTEGVVFLICAIIVIGGVTAGAIWLLFVDRQVSKICARDPSARSAKDPAP